MAEAAIEEEVITEENLEEGVIEERKTDLGSFKYLRYSFYAMKVWL
jgi:hypothetical protein